MDKFTERARQGWDQEDRTEAAERMEDFILARAEEIGVVLDSVNINEGVPTVTFYSDRGVHEMNVFIDTARPEVSYGQALIAMCLSVMEGAKTLRANDIFAPLSDHAEKIMAQLTAYDKVLADQAKFIITGGLDAAKRYPGTREADAVGGKSLMYWGPQGATPNLRDAVKITLAQAIYDAIAGNQDSLADMLRDDAPTEDIWEEIAERIGDDYDKTGKAAQNQAMSNPIAGLQLSESQTAEEFAKEINKLATSSSGVSTEKWASEEPKKGALITENSPATDIIREHLMDERLERDGGQYVGLVSQPQRIVTDLRVMSKRMILEDVPDTLLVVLVDNSGSMQSGQRWPIAERVHDSVMKAMYDLGIPATSAAFDQMGGECITRICKQDTAPIRLGSAACPRGGTGDLGAMTWAAGQLNESGKAGRVVLVISDNESPTDPPKMKRALKALGANVVHVDLVGRQGSTYGVEPLILKKLPEESDWETLAVKLKEALNLQGEVQ